VYRKTHLKPPSGDVPKGQQTPCRLFTHTTTEPQPSSVSSRRTVGTPRAEQLVRPSGPLSPWLLIQRRLAIQFSRFRRWRRCCSRPPAVSKSALRNHTAVGIFTTREFDRQDEILVALIGSHVTGGLPARHQQSIRDFLGRTAGRHGGSRSLFRAVTHGLGADDGTRTRDLRRGRPVVEALAQAKMACECL